MISSQQNSHAVSISAAGESGKSTEKSRLWWVLNILGLLIAAWGFAGANLLSLPVAGLLLGTWIIIGLYLRVQHQYADYKEAIEHFVAGVWSGGLLGLLIAITIRFTESYQKLSDSCDPRELAVANIMTQAGETIQELFEDCQAKEGVGCELIMDFLDDEKAADCVREHFLPMGVGLAAGLVVVDLLLRAFALRWEWTLQCPPFAETKVDGWGRYFWSALSRGAMVGSMMLLIFFVIWLPEMDERNLHAVGLFFGLILPLMMIHVCVSRMLALRYFDRENNNDEERNIFEVWIVVGTVYWAAMLGIIGSLMLETCIMAEPVGARLVKMLRSDEFFGEVLSSWRLEETCSAWPQTPYHVLIGAVIAGVMFLAVRFTERSASAAAVAKLGGPLWPFCGLHNKY